MASLTWQRCHGRDLWCPGKTCKRITVLSKRKCVVFCKMTTDVWLVFLHKSFNVVIVIHLEQWLYVCWSDTFVKFLHFCEEIFLILLLSLFIVQFSIFKGVKMIFLQHCLLLYVMCV